MANTMKITSIPKRWLKRFRDANESVKLPGWLGGLTLPLKLDGVSPTRIGVDEKDNKPFYESRIDQLYAFYSTYRDSRAHRYRVLYADVTAISSDNLAPIFENGFNERDVVVEISNREYRPPTQIIKHAKTAVEIFKNTGKLQRVDGEWENNDCFSVQYFQDGLMRCQGAKYFDQVGTNITIDWESGLLPDGGTIRNSLEKNPQGRLPSFEDSSLANTLGTAVMVLNRELRPIMRVRNPNMGSIPHAGLHVAVSGVLEPKTKLEPGRYNFDVFQPGTRAEIESEMGLSTDDYKLYPLAFARELPRGGKPQLFWVAITKLSDDEIRDKMKNAKEKYEFVPTDEFDFFDKDIEFYSEIAERFTYEGLASFLFTEQFLITNRDKIVQQP